MAHIKLTKEVTGQVKILECTQDIYKEELNGLAINWWGLSEREGNRK